MEDEDLVLLRIATGTLTIIFSPEILTSLNIAYTTYAVSSGTNITQNMVFLGLNGLCTVWMVLQ